MDFSYDKQMGSRIRLLREARHLTQEQLAAKLQVRGCDITRSALAGESSSKTLLSCSDCVCFSACFSMVLSVCSYFLFTMQRFL